VRTVAGGRWGRGGDRRFFRCNAAVWVRVRPRLYPTWRGRIQLMIIDIEFVEQIKEPKYNTSKGQVLDRPIHRSHPYPPPLFAHYI
jgi:hypothetical protein